MTGAAPGLLLAPETICLPEDFCPQERMAFDFLLNLYKNCLRGWGGAVSNRVVGALPGPLLKQEFRFQEGAALELLFPCPPCCRSAPQPHWHRTLLGVCGALC